MLLVVGAAGCWSPLWSSASIESIRFWVVWSFGVLEDGSCSSRRMTSVIISSTCAADGDRLGVRAGVGAGGGVRIGDGAAGVGVMLLVVGAAGCWSPLWSSASIESIRFWVVWSFGVLEDVEDGSCSSRRMTSVIISSTCAADGDGLGVGAGVGAGSGVRIGDGAAGVGVGMSDRLKLHAISDNASTTTTVNM